MIIPYLEEALQLINEDDNYIIFNDGKPIRTKLPDNVFIEMNNFFDANDYLTNTDTALTDEIATNAKFAPTLNIGENIDLKVIHLNKKEEYIDYHIFVKSHIKAFITNVYFKVANKSKIKMDVVCETKSCVTIKNITNAYGDLTMNVRSYCLKSSSLKIDDLSISDKNVKYNNIIYLVDEYSNCEMNNIVLSTMETSQNFDYRIIHYARDTKSIMNSYGVAKNNSHLSFDCRGRIEAGAKNAIMEQHTKGLIMDLSSSIASKPILEIEENEVVANHGAAIGAIDEEELYYLMSRGLTREISEKLILNTHIAPYYKDIKDELILSYVHKEVEIQLS